MNQRDDIIAQQKEELEKLRKKYHKKQRKRKSKDDQIQMHQYTVNPNLERFRQSHTNWDMLQDIRPKTIDRSIHFTEDNGNTCTQNEDIKQDEIPNGNDE